MKTKNRTILIIDDDKIITEIVCKLLSDAGYNTLYSNKGEKGISIFKKKSEQIDAVILDFVLIDNNGIFIYNELIKLNKDIKVLFTSGGMNKKKLNKVLQYKNTNFIQKPFSLNELLEKIEQLLNIR